MINRDKDPIPSRRHVHARFLLTFLCACILCAVCVYLFNFAVDPLQYYRIQIWREPAYFSGYQRFQNVGLARNYTYDTAIIGSSLMENFRPSHIARAWGAQAVKLAISGSTPYEQRLILGQALYNKGLRTVIWGLEPGGFLLPVHRVRDDEVPFPYYMYRSFRVTNVEYPLSLDTLHLSIFILQGHGEHDLDKLDTLQDRFTFGEAAVLGKWRGDCHLFTLKYRPDEDGLSREALQIMRASLHANLTEVIKQNPGVNFILMFPPISTLAYIPARTAYLPFTIALRRLLVEELDGVPNVRFFDFAVAEKITEDLDNYMDSVHFSSGVTDIVIDAIKSGAYEVHRDEMESTIARLVDQVNNFNLCREGRLRVAGERMSEPH